MKYKNVALPNEAAVKTLLKHARSHNSDNVFVISCDSGRVVSQRFVSRESEDTAVPKKGTYELMIHSGMCVLTKKDILDVGKSSIEMAIDYGLEV